MKKDDASQKISEHFVEVILSINDQELNIALCMIDIERLAILGAIVCEILAKRVIHGCDVIEKNKCNT